MLLILLVYIYIYIAVTVPEQFVSDVDADLHYFTQLEQSLNEFSVNECRNHFMQLNVDINYFKILGYNIRSFFKHMNLCHFYALHNFHPI